MAARRTASTRPFLALVWLALAAGCGRTVLYGDPSRDAEDPLDGNGGEGADGSGGSRAGRGGRSGTGGDASSTGGSNTAGSDGSGGTSTGSGATGPSTGGSFAAGGSSAGNSTGATSSGGSAVGGTDSGGNGSGGVSGQGASAGQGAQAGKGGQAGEPNNPDVPCGDTVCDVTETCCVGLTATACLPDGTECNGAVLNCNAPSYCGEGLFCCLTMGGGMATAECSDECANSFDGSGRLRLRLCESDADCTPNRECRMTFVGVTACMRRL